VQRVLERYDPSSTQLKLTTQAQLIETKQILIVDDSDVHKGFALD